MRRIFTYILILIAGISLTQYQIFSHGKIFSVLSETFTNTKVYTEIRDLNEKLAIMSAKFLKMNQNPSSTKEPEESDEIPVNTNTSIDRTILNAENILYFSNLERTKRGLKPLKFSAKLTRSATSKNSDMFTNQYFAHESPVDPKKGFAYFIDNESYDFVRVSENLAMGDFDTAKSVVDAWMNSPSHRVNILYADYQNIGVNVRIGNFKGSQVAMIVQHFGIPKNACPSVSEAMLHTLQSVEQDALTSKKTAEDLEKKINQNTDASDEELDSLIGVYNATIRNYNNLVLQFKKISAEYNEQVKEYDDCIKKLN